MSRGPQSPSRDGRRARGQRSREAVLTEAVQLASVEGLEGLTSARLADRLDVAKSSVHAAFGSKESLQLATVARAREILIDLVVAPVLTATPGRAALVALGESWIGYLERDIFEGGCLLVSASAELDGRPGAPRDAVAAVMREWLDFLAANVRAGIADGDFARGTDPAQIAFKINAIGMAANWYHQLFGGSMAFVSARTAWADQLERQDASASTHSTSSRVMPSGPSKNRKRRLM